MIRFVVWILATALWSSIWSASAQTVWEAPAHEFQLTIPAGWVDVPSGNENTILHVVPAQTPKQVRQCTLQARSANTSDTQGDANLFLEDWDASHLLGRDHSRADIVHFGNAVIGGVRVVRVTANMPLNAAGHSLRLDIALFNTVRDSVVRMYVLMCVAAIPLSAAESTAIGSLAESLTFSPESP